MQEKLSLAARFGLTIYYGKPEKKEFDAIVKGIASKYPELSLTEEELLLEANRWSLDMLVSQAVYASEFFLDKKFYNNDADYAALIDKVVNRVATML